MDGVNMQRVEVDCSTGEVKEIALTFNEIELLETEWAKNSAAITAELAGTDKTAAAAKLAALGLTTDDLKALGLN
jgi:hypothetical protein